MPFVIWQDAEKIMQLFLVGKGVNYVENKLAYMYMYMYMNAWQISPVDKNWLKCLNQNEPNNIEIKSTSKSHPQFMPFNRMHITLPKIY